MDTTGNEVVRGEPMGLIGQWIALGTGVAGRAIGTCFGILQDVRGEVGQRVSATIDWIDGSQQGTARLLRQINQRLDTLSKESLEAGELALTGVVRGVRTTSDEATRFASRAASVLVETRITN